MPTDPQTILQRIDLGKLLVTAVVVWGVGALVMITLGFLNP
jgi:uncharacterized membrane protein (GlpM family)